MINDGGSEDLSMLSRWADLDSVLCDDFGLGIVGLVQGRKRSRRVHGIGSIVNLRNGFLGGNDADFWPWYYLLPSSP